MFKLGDYVKFNDVKGVIVNIFKDEITLMTCRAINLGTYQTYAIDLTFCYIDEIEKIDEPTKDITLLKIFNKISEKYIKNLNV